MQSESENVGEKGSPPHSRTVISDPDYGRPIKPIAELLTHPDFPHSALGEYVDIGGYTGVITQIVKDSVRVRSPEGVTKGFNANGLRRIYGPVVRPEPTPVPPPTATRPAPAPSPWKEKPAPHLPPPPPPPPPPPEPVVEPDFTKPVKLITEFVKRGDYPQCLLGEHVDIAGYAGVVVQIVNRSLKVRAQSDITRSYNAEALRRLYG